MSDENPPESAPVINIRDRSIILPRDPSSTRFLPGWHPVSRRTKGDNAPYIAHHYGERWVHRDDDGVLVPTREYEKRHKFVTAAGNKMFHLTEVDGHRNMITGFADSFDPSGQTTDYIARWLGRMENRDLVKMQGFQNTSQMTDIKTNPDGRFSWDEVMRFMETS